MHENSSESTQTLIYVHRNKQIQIQICAQALEFSHIHASKVHSRTHFQNVTSARKCTATSDHSEDTLHRIWGLRCFWRSISIPLTGRITRK